MTATIFDIKRYSINDGPGIRVTIFFKGCPLRCQWCHNPESFSARIEKMYNASKCIGAQACVEICPYDALTLTKDGIVTDTSKCDLCGKCAEVCPTKAIEMTGYQETLDNILKEIEKERIVIDQSGVPYHNIAAHKYKKLGKDYDQTALREPTQEEIGRTVEIFLRHGLEIIIGG